MKPNNVGLITVTTLRANPGAFVPILLRILRVYDQYRAQDLEQPVHVPSFTILPMPSSHRRFVCVNPETIRNLTGHPALASTATDEPRSEPPFMETMEIFWNVFRLDRFGYAR